MNIIPAIDIKNGKVVKANKGDRENYTPIDSHEDFSSDPYIFIKKIIDIYRPKVLYIADINSLTNNKNNIDLIKNIADQNRGSRFWVDIGGKVDQRLNKKNIVPILCSESCLSIKNINYIYKDYIHSYDFKNKLLGVQSFRKFSSSYKNKVIFMNISDVGNDKGPDYKFIRSVNKKATTEYYVGGGVKTILDINKLKLMGFSGVLVSSILFKNYTSSYLIKKRAGR